MSDDRHAERKPEEVEPDTARRGGPRPPVRVERAVKQPREARKRRG